MFGAWWADNRRAIGNVKDPSSALIGLIDNIRNFVFTINVMRRY